MPLPKAKKTMQKMMENRKASWSIKSSDTYEKIEVQKSKFTYKQDVSGYVLRRLYMTTVLENS